MKNIQLNPKSEKLIALKAARDAVHEDYQNPQRSAIIQAYHEELKACGRLYFDDRVEAWAVKNGGSKFGEDTMLEMIDEQSDEVRE